MKNFSLRTINTLVVPHVAGEPSPTTFHVIPFSNAWMLHRSACINFLRQACRNQRPVITPTLELESLIIERGYAPSLGMPA